LGSGFGHTHASFLLIYPSLGMIIMSAHFQPLRAPRWVNFLAHSASTKHNETQFKVLFLSQFQSGDTGKWHGTGALTPKTHTCHAPQNKIGGSRIPVEPLVWQCMAQRGAPDNVVTPSSL